MFKAEYLQEFSKIRQTDGRTNRSDERRMQVNKSMEERHLLKRIYPLPPFGYGFQQTETVFKVIKVIIKTIALTKFHDDRSVKKKNAQSPGCHIYIIGTNLLTKFHEDRIINVDYRVLTRFYHSHIMEMYRPLTTITIAITIALHNHIKKNDAPPGGHVFQATKTIFKLVPDIIETNVFYIIGINVMTKFSDDRTPYMEKCPALWQPNILGTNHRTINVASRVLNGKCCRRTRNNARRTKGDHKSSP
ncbi:hypothetical protein DPMN_033713 [Dreissena polymorpha]|uniref:Uncharacterized protein n=1 Tax=Dreissena polymorpha TaxID=45954 RepID=A0A9D4RJD6_DREPO|nr:hypothetical protein DPMN_033713 [Dreissena polymorpha]